MKLLNAITLGTEHKNIPLLVIHGIFGSADNWKTLGKKYAEFCPVHLLDLRNHGRSFHDDEMNFQVMTADLVNYIKSIGAQKINLIGHSLGGKVAMEFAQNYPELLNKVIVADIAPIEYPPHHQSIIAGLNAIDFDEIKDRKDADEVLKKYIPELGIRQFLLKNIYRTKEGKYSFRFNLKVLDKNYKQLIGSDISDHKYLGEMLFLKGEKSNYIQEQDLPLIESLFPNYSLQTVAKAGHWLHAENPSEFFKLSTDFFSLG